MQRPRVSRLLTVLTLALLVSACTQWRYELGTRVSPDLLPEDGPDITLTEILAKLGPPLRMSAAGEGYVLAWEFWKIREDTFGLSLGAMGADVLSVDWGNAHMHGEFLLVTFNRQHQMTGRAFSRWSNDAGGGQSVQPLVGLVSLVDVEDMVGNLPQHQWGAGLLRPLPQAINAQSRPDTGQNGVQRRGTPNGVGQRSLE